MHDTLHARKAPCGRVGRAMTRCECTGVAFDEVARLVAAGRSPDEAQAESGAGLLCTACVPDLREHLAASAVRATEGQLSVAACGRDAAASGTAAAVGNDVAAVESGTVDPAA